MQETLRCRVSAVVPHLLWPESCKRHDYCTVELSMIVLPAVVDLSEYKRADEDQPAPPSDESDYEGLCHGEYAL